MRYTGIGFLGALAAITAAFWAADQQYTLLGFHTVAAFLNAIVPIGSGPEVVATRFSVFKHINPVDILESAVGIIKNSFADDGSTAVVEGYTTAASINYVNKQEPSTSVYPKEADQDAPYSLTEAALRASIYIPAEFQYGKKQIVLFLPGTGAFGGPNFLPGFGKLFKQQGIADPVYLNIPNKNVGDVQIAAEYTAYAINYISAISGGAKMATISWSAGSLDGQWAFKFWPSTRSKVTDAIRISPDHHGTVLGRPLCRKNGGFTCTPAVKQQLYYSSFMDTLRKNGGDSAYVPTTNIYSIFDIIVQPQADPIASGWLNDTRGVGVTNVELQSQCTAFLPGGWMHNNHEGTLINALAYALAVDAIKHDGPGQLSRINVPKECSKIAADGLSIQDLLSAFSLIPQAAYAMLTYPTKASREPPLMAYAEKEARS